MLIAELDDPTDDDHVITRVVLADRFAIDECERFYPVFQVVLWGGKTPKEALAAAMTETQGEA